MTDPIDQNAAKPTKSTKTLPFNILSIVLLCFSLCIVAYTVLLIRHETNHPPSPWIPVHTPYFVNGALINFTVIQSIGIFPALAFRFTRHYKLSSAFIIVFMLAASIFKHTLNFYPHVFKMFN
jgi:hypothetical protein